MMLLQKCDMTLKAWLKEQAKDKITDDVQDAMIDFTIDIAKAMKHLHDLEVTCHFICTTNEWSHHALHVHWIRYGHRTRTVRSFLYYSIEGQ